MRHPTLLATALALSIGATGLTAAAAEYPAPQARVESPARRRTSRASATG